MVKPVDIGHMQRVKQNKGLMAQTGRKPFWNRSVSIAENGARAVAKLVKEFEKKSDAGDILIIADRATGRNKSPVTAYGVRYKGQLINNLPALSYMSPLESKILVNRILGTSGDTGTKYILKRFTSKKELLGAFLWLDLKYLSTDDSRMKAFNKEFGKDNKIDSNKGIYMLWNIDDKRWLEQPRDDIYNALA